MPSLIPGYEYDIFISYRQKDNKGDRWVSEFVEALKTELESTFKEEISVYFDINPSDGLLETHDVDASLKEKLKCLVFIPIISRTYCDPKSFAWEHEFKAFVEQASQDQFGLKVKLPNGNVANRVLPVRIHDLDNDDMKLCESVLDGVLRGIDFIYKEPGVDRPLTSDDDERNNLNKTKYRNQVNKVALAIKEIITAIKKHNQQDGEVPKDAVRANPKMPENLKTKIIIATVITLALIVFVYFFIPKLFKPSKSVEKSIAILPFINDSPSDSNKYFINGVMEDILSDLQTIKELRPISRTSAEKYRTTTKSIPEIAKELGVNYIVEGSGQKSGNTIRLIVKLFRAYKEGPLWGNTYEQEMHDAGDIFRIQSQIAETIATELKAVITPQEKQLIQKTPTANLEAYYAYLQGILYLRKYTPLDHEVALKYFEQAIEKDPKYVLPYTGICSVWIGRTLMGSASPAEATPKAMAALKKALELDSTRAEVYFTLAGIQSSVNWDWKGAESSIKKSIVLKPNEGEFHATYALFLLNMGRMKEAKEQDELSLKLDPLNINCKVIHGWSLLFFRRYDDAILAFQEVLKTDPFNMAALSNLPEAFHMVGKYKEEFEAWKSYYATSFKDFVNVFDQVNAKANYVNTLNLEADTLVAQSKIKYILPTEIALIYACVGNKERAMDMLDRAYEMHDPNLPCLLHPGYDSLRNEPRFQELARKINVPYK
jgi:TolB-like protein